MTRYKKNWDGVSEKLENKEGWPDEIKRHKNGNIKEQIWYDENGEYHRIEKQARITYFPNESVKDLRWYEHGEHHRENGPAVIKYYSSGSIMTKQWFKHDKLHKEKGPAVIEYNSNGSIMTLKWYIEDKLHKDDGPAYVTLDDKGKIQEKSWYLEGREVSEKEWESWNARVELGNVFTEIGLEDLIG